MTWAMPIANCRPDDKTERLPTDVQLTEVLSSL
jgi:hypothetical protein